jgi:hypothetical protein
VRTITFDTEDDHQPGDEILSELRELEAGVLN